MSNNDHSPDLMEIADLRRLLAQREREIADLRNSSSWRMTAPLRRMVNWLRTVKAVGHQPIFGTRGVPNGIERSDYQAWIAAYGSIGQSERAKLTSSIDTFASRPVVSIIMPNFNVELGILAAAIDSVRRQIYQNWELCISDDASTLDGTRALLEKYAAEEPRIRVHFRDSNGNISANSNSALSLATGDYMALLDADDVLSEDALFWVAREISRHPEADLIFTDEDKIDENGRYDPYFKTAWNPALMLSQNSFSHLGVYRRALVEKVGGFRDGYEGAQDHDLVLRCAQQSSPDRIRHIPRVLYHWRAVTGSTAAALESKPKAWRAGRRAITEHLERSGVPGEVQASGSAYYQINYCLPDPVPLISLVVATRLKNDVTLNCLQSILDASSYPKLEMVLSIHKDDLVAASGNRAAEGLLSDARVTVTSHDLVQFNYSKVNNDGVAAARGDFICFLNDDVKPISANWLETLVTRVLLDGVCAAGPKLLYPTNTIQHAGVLLGIGGVADHAFRNLDRGETGYFARSDLEQDYSCLTSACLLVRRDAFNQVGGFDVGLPVAFNDIDLCLRLRGAGYRLVWTPAAELYHYESLSFGPPETATRRDQYLHDRSLMRTRWAAILEDDPYYNPNLSLEPGRQFKLSSPPRVTSTDQLS